MLWRVSMNTSPLDSDPVIIISKFSALGKGFDHSNLLISVYRINELIREWQRWKHQEHNGCSWTFLDFYLKNFSLQLLYFYFMESDLFSISSCEFFSKQSTYFCYIFVWSSYWDFRCLGQLELYLIIELILMFYFCVYDCGAI